MQSLALFLCGVVIGAVITLIWHLQQVNLRRKIKVKFDTYYDKNLTGMMVNYDQQIRPAFPAKKVNSSDMESSNIQGSFNEVATLVNSIDPEKFNQLQAQTTKMASNTIQDIQDGKLDMQKLMQQAQQVFQSVFSGDAVKTS